MVALSARFPELPVVLTRATYHGVRAMLWAVKTRNLLILAAVTGLVIVLAGAWQILTDPRFLG